MRQTQATLSDQVVARHPLDVGGASGNTVERVTLRDGRDLICKRVSQEWDWISRATNDRGRAVSMWDRGLFQRIPPAVHHATVAVEPDGPAWSVFMHDVSDALVPDDRRLDRASVRRVLAAMAEVHLTFRGERFPELCGLEDRYRLLSPQTARRERERGNPVGDVIDRCWEAFSELVPDDIASAILTIVDRPRLLAEQLEKCEQTLIHGDLRLSNLGFLDDRLVLIDWGERTGTAPAAVELASFLVFDARRLDASRKEVIADFRGFYGDHFDEAALQLALIGGLVQLGCHPVLDMVLGGGDAARAAAVSELDWWTTTVAAALETWSPI
ncbi:MAG: aminoglycoside phosphotransferase family protein [Actinomycetota bacterium]|nr:aminoglycoside phosphotransferase family protein [Actinomycetota bacterium]